MKPLLPLSTCLATVAFACGAGTHARADAFAADEVIGGGRYAHYGLLRERDLTPFDFLRLDMRPAHAAWSQPGSWGVEVLLGYQNTWAMSSNVKHYLDSLPGRRTLGPDDARAIAALQGEAYLVDLELGMLDVALHRKLDERWSLYAIFGAVSYGGGFLDGTIEKFHSAFGFNSYARPAVERNDVNVILDLKGTQGEVIRPSPSSGLVDPTVGLRYSVMPAPSPWNLVLEGAMKIPFRGRRDYLSSGHFDIGVQATLQRFMGRHALHASLAAVNARNSMPNARRSKLVPTAIAGYEYGYSDRTSFVVQGHASRSALSREDTELDELLGDKYQYSIGLRHRIGRALWTFAITENAGNVNNTPDFGFQIGWTYSPALAR